MGPRRASASADVMHIATRLLSFGILIGAASCDVISRPCSCTADVLDCSERNKASILPEEICSRATKVNLDKNQLTIFPQGLNNFREVSANYNNLTRLPHAILLSPALKVLRLKFNKINETSDELSSLSSLEELRLDYNELTSLDFLPRICNLRILSLLNTKISNLEGPLQSCEKLTHLYITSGSIRVLSDAIFSQMPHLEELWLSDQSIVSIPGGTFRNLKKLKSLVLSSNNNITLSETSLEGLRDLETIDLSACSLTMLPNRLFVSTPRIENIDLYLNVLTSLPVGVFSGLHWLTDVNLGLNFLTEIPLLRNCCTHLETFQLFGNKISALSNEPLRAALLGSAIIDLEDNPIQSHSLRWVLRAPDITTYVNGSCNCGGVKLKRASAKFCVDIHCGREDTPVDWRDAVET